MGVKATVQTYRAPDWKKPEQTVALSLSGPFNQRVMSLWTCYPRSMRRALVPSMNTRRFGAAKPDGIRPIRCLLDVNAKYQVGPTARGQGQRNKSVLVVQLLSSDGVVNRHE